MQHRRFFIRLKLGEDVKISGQTTDSGGGDVGHSLMKELQKLYIIDPNHFALYMGCNLLLQILLKLYMEKVV